MNNDLIHEAVSSMPAGPTCVIRCVLGTCLLIPGSGRSARPPPLTAGAPGAGDRGTGSRENPEPPQELGPAPRRSPEPVDAAAMALSQAPEPGLEQAQAAALVPTREPEGAPRTGVSFAARAGQAAALVQVQELEQPPVQTPAPDPHKVQAMALIASGAGATTESGSRPGGLQPVLPSASAPELSHPRRAPGPALELPRARRQL